MYLRWVRFSLGAGQRAVFQALADEIVPVLAVQPGCRHVSVCGDEADGNGGLIALWETAPQAKAAARTVRSRLDALLAGHRHGVLETSLFEVFAHHVPAVVTQADSKFLDPSSLQPAPDPFSHDCLS